MTLSSNTTDLKSEVIREVRSAVPDTQQTDFTPYRLENSSNKLVGSVTSITANEVLQFYTPEILTPMSSSKWNQTVLRQLQVQIVDVKFDEFLKVLHMENIVNPASESLVHELSKLNLITLQLYGNPNMQEDLRYNHEYAMYRLPITKALFLSEKYPSHESMVDSFVLQLLQALGFNNGMTYTVPQLRLLLKYGIDSNDFKESIADFVVLDVLSFHKLFIIEDKSVDNQRLDSTPQLFAEAIAMKMANELKPLNESNESGVKRKHNEEVDDTFLGVRVNGTIFHFYAIHISPEIQQAMRSKNCPTTATAMYRLDDESGFNFLDNKKREDIIRLLGIVQNHVTETGASSPRRKSLT